MNKKRIRKLNNIPDKNGKILYWMQRDQRVFDNWAILHAQDLSEKYNSRLIVCFCLVPEFLEASIRQYDFMINNLKKVEKKLKKLNIPFFLLTGNPIEKITEFIKKQKITILVSDFNPLKIKKYWNQKIIEKIDIPYHEVDTHNIVPCSIASSKQEYAAYTLRPKINKKLVEFLDEFPKPKKQHKKISFPENDWNKAEQSLNINTDAARVDWLESGEESAKKVMRDFIKNKLKNYPHDKNDPNKDAESNLSPYLHFGQISSQRVALEVIGSNNPEKSKDQFLEQLIVRKELADNFCYYNDTYDTVDCFSDWAKRTLSEHKNDKRNYIYTKQQFEKAKTHDRLWNAAQTQMISTGKMHGYMRMYWAKKILEWTKSPEYAMEIAIYLNDKYQLDGRDPNGYAGIAWSIGGVHDRAWREREIFGKIRFMNKQGCKRKFDIKRYIKNN
ncbi:deoxyribodipyrimidine photo-lyase [Candidatus Woesearchaeota archaeon]|nr:deoxyribodipyrimidine photo-lyase [Candidatus Woesearchaeota archaeon]